MAKLDAAAEWKLLNRSARARAKWAEIARLTAPVGPFRAGAREVGC